MTGKFIVFDGLDGTGKTTFIKMLSEYLESKGFKVSVTCLLYTSPSPRDRTRSRMPSSA